RASRSRNHRPRSGPACARTADRHGLVERPGPSPRAEGRPGWAARRRGGVRRRGKYILLEVTGFGGEGVIIHLGMTGRLRVQPAATARAPHTHVVFAL